MCDNHGNTPLHRAALVDAFNIIKFLLGCGASPLMCNADGETPANVAIAQANATSAGILREHIKLLQSCPMQPTNLCPSPCPPLLSRFCGNFRIMAVIWEFCQSSRGMRLRMVSDTPLDGRTSVFFTTAQEEQQ